jgi:Fe-S-cluster-containing hydrogenase component 2
MTMLLIAADRCTGCRMCELACPLVHEGAFNPDKSRIWIEFEGMPELFYPNSCRSCGKPPCADVCPTEPKSIYRDEKVGGGMKILEDVCIKCGKCIEACPFAAIDWHPTKKTPLVCDVCDGDPECVKFCSPNALLTGGKSNLAAEKRKDYAAAQIAKTREKILK